VPNNVLVEKSYRKAVSGKLGQIERLKYFNLRDMWLRDLNIFGGFQKRVTDFLQYWDRMGIVEETRVARSAKAFFPSKVHIEKSNQLESTKANQHP